MAPERETAWRSRSRILANRARRHRPARNYRNRCPVNVAMTARFCSALFGVFVAALLSACASPGSVTPGTIEADVLARLGQPDDTHALSTTGARRFEYRMGPVHQTKYMIDLDGAGRVTRVAQVHDADRFFAVRTGQDTVADVRREFGAPRLVQRYLAGYTVWLYPYLEAGSFPSEMAIYFDADGRVQRVESGPDPRFLGGANGRDG